MRITVSMPSTGLVFAPGLAKPVVIEVDQLPKELAEELVGLAERAGLFNRSETLKFGDPQQSRDGQRTIITVEEGDKRRMIELSDPVPDITNEPLRKFVERVREHARSAQRQRIKKTE